MTEVYFGGDGCPTCGVADMEPWNRPHRDWCADMRARLPFSLASPGSVYGEAYERRHPGSGSRSVVIVKEVRRSAA